MADIHVLGALVVHKAATDHPRVSGAVQQLIGLLVAAGPNGISKDEVATDVWGDDLPQSWKSLLRNRMTQIRKLLGPESVVNRSTRYVLDLSGTVDAWQLLAWDVDQEDNSDNPFGFLAGEPFEGIQLTPKLIAYAQDIEAFRAARIQHVVSRVDPLSPLALQRLRAYQRLHPLDATTTQQTVIAHLGAGDRSGAAEIIAQTRAKAVEAGFSPDWIDQLDNLGSRPDAGSEIVDSSQGSTGPSMSETEAAEIRARAEIFAGAAENNDWSMALEIAMSGLPAAEKINGDPERLKLLKAIPIDNLAPGQQLSLATTLAQHCMLVHEEARALEWSRKAWDYCQSPDDELVAFLTGVTVGDAPDERVALRLPAAFDQSTDLVRSMRSLQLVAVSHLERSPAPESAAMVERLTTLADSCADPYRRWHALLLQAMLKFVAGEWDAAQAAAAHAHKHGELFGAADAPGALLGQSLNPAWVHPGFAPKEVPPASPTTPIDYAMYASLRNDIDDVDAYIDKFDCESRAHFVVPVLVLVAHKVRSDVNRRRVESRLRQRAGTSTILGSGAMHFGPVDRALARVTSDPDARDYWSASAIEVADVQQTRVWQVACRLERASLTNDAALVAEARELANTSFLQHLVAIATE